jgi:predicted small lipoprotein YifL
MKKVFMSFAVVALMVAASACGNNAKKAEAETEAVEEVEAVADTVAACCDSTATTCDSTVVAE